MHRRTRTRLIFGSLAVVIIAALAWATISFANSSSALDGTHWNLTLLNGQPLVSADVTVDLSFQPEQHMSGRGGCNSYGGTYAATGHNLSFDELFSTEMACLDSGLMGQESAYLSALGHVARYDLAGDTLTLKDASGAALLVFTRAQ